MKSQSLRVVLLGLLIVTGVAVGGWAVHSYWPPSAPADPPDPEPAEGVVCLGFVDLEHGLRHLSPLEPGRVAEVLIEEGRHVEAGTPLIKVEEVDVRLRVKEAEHAVAAAEAEADQVRKLPLQHQARLKQQRAAIEALIARLAGARANLVQQEELFRAKVINDRVVTTAREQVRELEAQEQAELQKLVELELIDPEAGVRRAEAELGVARARLDQAKNALENCTLKAPSPGTVQRILVGKGDVVGNRSAVQFCPDEPRLIRAEVAQEFADRVRVGQEAVVRDDARPQLRWQAHIVRVADWYAQRRPNPQDPSAFLDVRTIECLLTVDDGPEPLRIGQRVRVLIGRVPEP